MKQACNKYLSIYILTILLLSNAPIVAEGNQSAQLDRISANRELVEPKLKGKYIYPAAYAFDGDKETVWAYHGQNDGWIGFGLKNRSTVYVDEIQIINGFAKNERLYFNNNRIKEISFVGYGSRDIRGKHQSFSLSDNKLDWQSFKFNQAMSVSSISIGVKGVFPGKKYDDTCLAEVRLLYKGVPITFSNLNSIVAQHKEKALQKVNDANQSFAGYFRELYAKNGFECSTLDMGFKFSTDYVELDAPGFNGNTEYKIEGNKLIIPKNRYVNSTLKFNLKVIDLDTILFNGTPCSRRK